MTQRLDFAKAAPDAFRAVGTFSHYVNTETGLPPLLTDLIKLRASQINGCSYCVDMHSKEARAHGAGEQWIDLVSAWRESPVFSDRERAVLGWTESLTLLAQTGVPDDVYETLARYFSPAEMTKITVTVGLINVWNRLCVGFRTPHPLDQPALAA